MTDISRCPLGRHAGFTLVELLVVLALLGTLATFAYPSYLRQVQHGQRTQTQAALLEQLLQQEQYLRQHGQYAHFAAGAGSSPFRAQPTGAASPYLLGARACDSQDHAPSHVCVEAFAMASSQATVSPELAIDSLGRSRCMLPSGQPCTLP